MRIHRGRKSSQKARWKLGGKLGGTTNIFYGCSPIDIDDNWKLSLYYVSIV